jgi:drug/metabolite transporter (DMT)-like permease
MYYVHLRKIYLAAALSTFLAVPLFSYLALIHLTLAFVYMSTALTHVMVLILSRMFLKEHITCRQYLSIVLIVIGIVIFNY